MAIAGRHLERSYSNHPVSVGRYAVERQLVEAGTGPVYLARDPEGRSVVIKVISAKFARDHEFRRRLRADLETVRTIAPRCLADIIDADTTAHPPYVVTEFVDAPTLATRVEEQGPLSAPDTRRLAIALVTALAGLHDAGLVFGDLKPANVVLSEGGLRLLDFGLSRVLNTVAGPNRGGSAPGMGTPAFITPEHVLRQPLTAASDIFTWGGVVLFAATGRLPFGDGTPQLLLQRAVYAEPDLTGLDPSLRGFVVNTMRKDPSRRPTAAELLAQLGGADAPGSSVADPAGPAPAVEGPRAESKAGAGTPAGAESKAGAGTPTESKAGAGTPAGAETKAGAGTPAGAAAAGAEAKASTETVAGAGTATGTGTPVEEGRSTQAVRPPEATQRAEAAPPADTAEAASPAGTSERPGPRTAGPAAPAGADDSVGPAIAVGWPGAARAARARIRADGRWPFRLFLIAIACLLMMTTVVEATGTVRAHAAATASRDTARQARELAVREPDLAAQLAVAAYDIAPTTAAGDALVAATVRRTGHLGGDVRDLAVAPDGRSLVTVGETGASVWDIADPTGSREIIALPVDGATVNAVAFASGPRRPASAGEIVVTAVGGGGGVEAAEGVRIWRVTADGSVERLGGLAGHGAPVDELEVSPDGSVLAAGSSDGTLRLWDVRDPRAPAELTDLRMAGPVTALAFSPDGDQLLVGGAGRLTLWSLHDPARPRRQGLVRGAGTVAGASYSPDGRTLAVSTTGLPAGVRAGVPIAVASSAPEKSRSVVEVYQPHDPRGLRRLTSFEPPGGAGDVAFSADGRALAVGGGPAPVSAAADERAGGVPGEATAAAGETGTGAGGAVTIWDMSDPTSPRSRLTLPAASASVATTFTEQAGREHRGSEHRGSDEAGSESGGRMLAVADGNGVRLWELDLTVARGDICRRVREEITRSDWRRYVPGRRYSPPCDQD